MNFLDYDQTYKIINGKFKLDHNEMKFILQKYNKDNTNIFLSDIPENNVYPLWTKDFIPFEPEFLFYKKEWVENLILFQGDKFVYFSDLKFKRMWHGDHTEIINLLIKAAKSNRLKWYVPSLNEFSLTKTFQQGNQIAKINWAETSEGEAYLKNTESFYLLYDILNIERIWMNKTREECFKELELADD